MPGAVHFKRVALIGIGLIGSSLAHVLRRDKLADRIVGNARTPETLKVAKRLKLVDETFTDAGRAVENADLVVICAPMLAYKAIGKAIAPHLKKGAIVTDVGSCKASTLRDLAPLLPRHVHFVPAHPVAGTENSGPEAGFAELFDGRWCILTPAPKTSKAAVNKVAALWRKAGMNVETMDAKHHDMVLAITSHLPHLIAYTIVGTATDLEDYIKGEVIKFAAGGFRDFTRIAASDPTMWRDVFLTNKDAVLEILGRFNEDLTALQRAIRKGDGETLFDHFTRTRAIRRSLIQAKQA
ncbi:MAG: prephenate/arogenate dehydrogenase family protein [Alphaproteobacteria bacterium]